MQRDVQRDSLRGRLISCEFPPLVADRHSSSLGILPSPSSALSVFKTVMATMLIFLLSLYLLLVPEQVNASSFPAQVPLADATEPLDSWLARQTPYALDGVLNNLGADGAKSIGANPGSVVASPSKAHPDCASPVPRFEVVR